MFEKKKEKREHNTLKRRYLCMKKTECEKKKSVWCVTVHIFVFFVENHRGEISLSQSESTVRNRRRESEENVQRC